MKSILMFLIVILFTSTAALAESEESDTRPSPPATSVARNSNLGSVKSQCGGNGTVKLKPESSHKTKVKKLLNGAIQIDVIDSEGEPNSNHCGSHTCLCPNCEADKCMCKPLGQDTYLGANGIAQDNPKDEAKLRQTLEAMGDSTDIVSLAARNNLANCLYFQGRYKEAEALYRFAAQEMPRSQTTNCEMAEINLANCLFMQQQYKEANEHYRVVLELCPDRHLALWAQKTCLSRIELGR